MKRTLRKIKANCKCASFDIEVTATIRGRTLTKGEADDVKKKLQHQVTKSISTLPFAHVYPHEVKLG